MAECVFMVREACILTEPLTCRVIASDICDGSS